MAGRYLVLSFFVSAGAAFGRRFLDRVGAMAARFDDRHCSFFGVSIDPQDEAGGRLDNRTPGMRFFFDPDLRISRLYGVVTSAPGGQAEPPVYEPATYVLDPGLRVVAVKRFEEADAHADWLDGVLSALPALPPPFTAPQHAPVIVVPGILDAGLCRRLIAIHETDGGGESGYMVERDGRTVAVLNPGMKRRRDTAIEDSELRRTIVASVRRRLVPVIERAFQIRMSRIERYIVARYDAADRGHFRAHRDNTTRGTAHRQFAVSIGLDDAYDGGEVWFPEFGPALYRPPVGGALVFSCSLLHEVRPVTAGCRLVFLTFLYNDHKAEVRRANARYLDPPAAPAATSPNQPGGGTGTGAAA